MCVRACIAYSVAQYQGRTGSANSVVCGCVVGGALGLRGELDQFLSQPSCAGCRLCDGFCHVM